MHYFTTLKFPASQFSGFMHLSTKLSLLILHSDDFAFSHHDEFTRFSQLASRWVMLSLKGTFESRRCFQKYLSVYWRNYLSLVTPKTRLAAASSSSQEADSSETRVIWLRAQRMKPSKSAVEKLRGIINQSICIGQPQDGARGQITGPPRYVTFIIKEVFTDSTVDTKQHNL